MTSLRQRMIEDMLLRGLSEQPKIRNGYSSMISAKPP